VVLECRQFKHAGYGSLLLLFERRQGCACNNTDALIVATAQVEFQAEVSRNGLHA
jgi:hypothetical protein